MIVKLAILAISTRREREGKWILRAAGRVIFMLESRFSSRFRNILFSSLIYLPWLPDKWSPIESSETRNRSVLG